MLGQMANSELLILLTIGLLFWGLRKLVQIGEAEINQKKSAVAAQSERTHASKSSSHSTRGSSESFTFQEEKQAADERRRVWISYEDSYGDDSQRKIEIYNAQDDEYLFAWCCLRKGPRTFRRDRIKRWKKLDEQFEFDPLLERWFREEYPQGDNAIPWPRFKEMNGG
jgi:predicted DNA-binding transcriptional regulator YafY